MNIPDHIDRRFLKFHQKNPHVYKNIVRLARQAKQRGNKKIGIGMIFEVLRWNHLLQTKGDKYKLSNDFRSRYARLIMEQEIDLAEIFELRQLRARI